MPKISKEKPLHPHQVEILQALRGAPPISRPELCKCLHFHNWLGKWLGTPRSPGKYPDSLYERKLVDVENVEGSPDEKGRNCLFFFITKAGVKALNGRPKTGSKQGVRSAKKVAKRTTKKPAKPKPFDRSTLEAMPRTKLRKMAKEYKVSTTGTKQAMIDRFMQLA